ncbi:MAG TPA: metallophosphoesterase family protein [Planctomycetota bacterium]|nr:metallophosphoesterase family protein [Planctomycetota bacterium]
MHVKRAIVSDIHGNQVALEAVLADIVRCRVDEVVCLGDVIGYGARPRACVDHAREFKWSLRGNHELALFDAEEQKRFSARAADAIDWTRARLESSRDPENEARTAFLEAMPEKEVEGDVVYCHGSPRLPVTEYVFPTLGQRHPDRLKLIFGFFEHVAFVGHTHFPGVFTEEPVFNTPADLGNEYEIGPGKALINVGSVGQPRDRNNRASYVVFDGQTVVFRRVQYDIDVAASQVYAVAELDDGLGDRLYDGR